MKKVVCESLLIVLMAVSLSACSLQRPVAHHAVAYNRAVETAHDQTVLLNIVRSMKRHPQHHTAITQVLGTASNSLSPSLSLTLKNGEFTPWTPAGSATRTGQSLVTVTVLDDKEFIHGLLSPITLEQLSFFLSLGWPERLLGMLFVRQIDILNDDFQHPYCTDQNARKIKGVGKGRLVIYKNDPEASFVKVQCFGARLIHLREVEHLEIGDEQKVVFELKDVEESKLADLVLKAAQSGLRLEKVEEGESGKAAGNGSVTYRLVQSAKSKVLRFGDGREAYVDQPIQFRESVAAQNDLDEQTEKPGPFLLYFRSAQSVLYYLGEIMRAQASKNFSTATSFDELEPKIVSNDESAVLFAAWKRGPQDKSPVVSVEYDGETYVIPRFQSCDDGQVAQCHRSMQALTIVKQLIGLNKKRDSLSTTSVVTTVGGS